MGPPRARPDSGKNPELGHRKSQKIQTGKALGGPKGLLTHPDRLQSLEGGYFYPSSPQDPLSGPVRSPEIAKKAQNQAWSTGLIAGWITRSRPITEVKHPRAGIVLGWGTAWELPVGQVLISGPPKLPEGPPQDFEKRRKFYFCQTFKACAGSRKTATVLKSFLENSIMLLLYREFYWKVISFDGGPAEAAKTALKRVFFDFSVFWAK